MTPETIISNALIVDGGGGAPLHGDLAMGEDGLILGVGTNLPRTGVPQLIDAKGLTLAPGFIDVHSHSDISLMAAPDAIGKISQGVTSEIVGNCGLSCFPVSDRNRSHLQELWENYGIEISWDDFSSYASAFERRQPVTNVSSLCGHNTLRSSVLGYGNEPFGRSELDAMCEALHSCLSQGAAGFSTGLLYVPGKFSKTEELAALLRVIAPSSKPYTTHMRSEGDGLLEALDEAIGIALSSAAPKLHVSHLKTSGKRNWSKLGQALEKLAAARDAGLSVTADRYPYTESMTSLSIVLPPPYGDLDDVTLQNTLSTPAAFLDLINKLAENPARDIGATRLVSTAAAKFSEFAGQKLSEIGSALKMPPARVCAEILRADASGARAAFSGMSPENMHDILCQDFVCCGSDESARGLGYEYGRSHPRGFGSFPRFFGIVRERFGLPEAVRRMSSLPAQTFGLSKRGFLAPGFAADLVLFSPDEFSSTADFSRPHIPAKGISRVWVNGVLSYGEGRVVARAGRFLRNQNRHP